MPDDVSVPQGAEKYRIREEQPDESDFRKSTPPENASASGERSERHSITRLM